MFTVNVAALAKSFSTWALNLISYPNNFIIGSFILLYWIFIKGVFSPDVYINSLSGVELANMKECIP